MFYKKETWKQGRRKGRKEARREGRGRETKRNRAKKKKETERNFKHQDPHGAHWPIRKARCASSASAGRRGPTQIAEKRSGLPQTPRLRAQVSFHLAYRDLPPRLTAFPYRKAFLGKCNSLFCFSEDSAGEAVTNLWPTSRINEQMNE